MAGTDKLLHRLGYAESSTQRPMWRLSDGEGDMGLATIAEEVPIAMVYNGRPYAVVLGMPADLEDLAVGFSLTEGVVAASAALERVTVVRANHGIELQVELSAGDAERLAARPGRPSTRGGCGLCGVEVVTDALRLPRRLDHTLDLPRQSLWRAAAALAEMGNTNETTDIVRAGWADMAGELRVVREDVAPHNAVDKLLGALARANEPSRAGFAVVTGRANYEMVQKAAVCGVELLAAAGRPTGLAMRLAQAAAVTLVGVLGERHAHVYACPARLT